MNLKRIEIFGDSNEMERTKRGERDVHDCDSTKIFSNRNEMRKRNSVDKIAGTAFSEIYCEIRYLFDSCSITVSQKQEQIKVLIFLCMGVVSYLNNKIIHFSFNKIDY